MCIVRNLFQGIKAEYHTFSKYEIFSKKLTFLTSLYAQVIKAWKMLVFQKILVDLHSQSVFTKFGNRKPL